MIDITFSPILNFMQGKKIGFNISDMVTLGKTLTGKTPTSVGLKVATELTINIEVTCTSWKIPDPEVSPYSRTFSSFNLLDYSS